MTQAPGTDSVEALRSVVEAAVRLTSVDSPETGDGAIDAGALADRLAQLRDLARSLERSDLLPLINELEQTVAWLERQGGAGRDAPAAMRSALDLLLSRLSDDAPSGWTARQLAAIVNLRGLRRQPLKSPPPWAAPDPEGWFSPAAATAARSLADFRRGLLGLLAGPPADGLAVLARVCRRLDAADPGPRQPGTWGLAARIFDAAARTGAAHVRMALRRFATILESLLRNPETADPAVAVGLWVDAGVLEQLLCRDDSASRAADTAEAEFYGAASAALRAGATPASVIAALLDELMARGAYAEWLELAGVARQGADPDRLAAWLDRRSGPTPTTPGPAVLPAAVADHFERAEATLDRLEAEAAEPGLPSSRAGAPADRGTIPVDEALLEHLNIAAAEIRGARSRAEVNLGSLRGGLQDMERTIRALRAQLEQLEVESSAEGIAGPIPGGSAAGEGDMPEKLGALSRSIDELQGLQDALHALTEETESVLASQAGEDGELERGLLETRLAPLSDQLGRWTEAVEKVIGGGSEHLRVTGGEVMLERRMASALSDALAPLLGACAAASAGPLVLAVSQPRFDLDLELRYPGAAPDPGAWAAFRGDAELLGALVSRDAGASETTIRVILPGPPRSMDVVHVTSAGQRYALPVAGVAGARNRSGFEEADPAGAGCPALAAVLGLPAAGAAATAEPTNQVLLTTDGDGTVAVGVDAIHQRERVLARSPGPLLADNPWIWAVVVNEHRPPTLVLDCRTIVSALVLSAVSA